MGTPHPDDAPIEAFLAEARAELDRMERVWRAGHAREPEAWPLQMGLGEWWEAFETTDWTELETLDIVYVNRPEPS